MCRMEFYFMRRAGKTGFVLHEKLFFLTEVQTLFIGQIGLVVFGWLALFLSTSHKSLLILTRLVLEKEIVLIIK